MSKKILKHIDKEEIIEKLATGESVRAISGWLKKKHPNNRNLWLSSVTLQKFRKNNLQLEGQVLKDIQEAGRSQRQELDEQEKQKILQETNAYNKTINEIANSKLDVARKILELDAIIASRMEYWFNAVSTGAESASKGDKELRGFMDRQMALLAQYKKFIEGMADHTVDYNVNVNVMNEQAGIIREAIRECIAEFAPEQAMLFMEKLNKKLSNTAYRPELPAQVKLEDLHDADFKMIDEDADDK